MTDPHRWHGGGALEFGLGFKNRREEHVLRGKEQGQQMELIRVQAGSRLRRELDFVHRFPLSPFYYFSFGYGMFMSDQC